MQEKKKKIFPKVKKKFENFLTDESGKITKKGALGISATAALLSMIDDANAYSTYHFNDAFNVSHSNTGHGSHSSGDHCFPCGVVHSNTNIEYGDFRDVVVYYNENVGCTTNHASGMVNGHANVTPGGNDWDGDEILGITWHTNHVSHASHGSGGWC